MSRPRKVQSDMAVVGEALRDERRRLAAQERELRKKCDWSDPHDVREYKKDRKRRSRESALNCAVPDRRCPHCSRKKLESRRWRVAYDRIALRYRAVCLSCWRAGATGGPRTVEKLPLPVAVMTVEDPRYRLNPRALRLAREQTGLSARDFAAWLGWSAGRQQALESGSVRTVSQDTRDLLITFLRKRGALLSPQEKRAIISEDVGEAGAPRLEFLRPIVENASEPEEISGED